MNSSELKMAYEISRQADDFKSMDELAMAIGYLNSGHKELAQSIFHKWKSSNLNFSYLFNESRYNI